MKLISILYALLTVTFGLLATYSLVKGSSVVGASEMVACLWLAYRGKKHRNRMMDLELLAMVADPVFVAGLEPEEVEKMRNLAKKNLGL